MGMETAVTQGYPIQVKITDFVSALFVVIIVTFLLSAYPAKMASKFAAIKHL